jgi:hypothetical protein
MTTWLRTFVRFISSVVSGSMRAQGALKKKSDGPLRGWLVPRRPKKYQGWSDVFSRFVYRVFELSSPRNAQEHDKKKSRNNRFGIFLSIFL